MANANGLRGLPWGQANNRCIPAPSVVCCRRTRQKKWKTLYVVSAALFSHNMVGRSPQQVEGASAQARVAIEHREHLLRKSGHPCVGWSASVWKRGHWALHNDCVLPLRVQICRVARGCTHGTRKHVVSRRADWCTALAMQDLGEDVRGVRKRYCEIGLFSCFSILDEKENVLG